MTYDSLTSFLKPYFLVLGIHIQFPDFWRLQNFSVYVVCTYINLEQIPPCWASKTVYSKAISFFWQVDFKFFEIHSPKFHNVIAFILTFSRLEFWSATFFVVNILIITNFLPITVYILAHEKQLNKVSTNSAVHPKQFNIFGNYPFQTIWRVNLLAPSTHVEHILSKFSRLICNCTTSNPIVSFFFSTSLWLQLIFLLL